MVLMSRLILTRCVFAMLVQFDNDLNGTVELKEFKEESKKMKLGIANGLGFLPVQMVLEEGSFLKNAVERELTKLAAA